MGCYKTSDFSYSLPEELIAQYPLAKRSSSRLLCCNPKANSVQDNFFKDIEQQLNSGDLLIFNDTQVIPARLYGNKQTGGAVEILIERMQSSCLAIAHIKSSKAPKVGSYIYLRARENVSTANNLEDAYPQVDASDAVVEVIGRDGGLFKLKFNQQILPTLDCYGHQPLPPYINRAAADIDLERYQTIWAKKPGAVAAPTASLHFDKEVLQAIKDKGVQVGYVTLHVGAGTFQPLRTENLQDHVMHAEYLQLSTELCDKIKATKAAGGRVIAVGTTVVRCLEEGVRQARLQNNIQQDSEEVTEVLLNGLDNVEARSTNALRGHASDSKPWIVPYMGDTKLFIYPGYSFGCVDAMLTNFHLPRSSLLMLVCAFAGYDFIMQAYAHAVSEKYRFFSYGDAMWLDCKDR